MTAPQAQAGAFVDLHAHSTASDGSKSPEEFVALAHQAGLRAVALTDHDTVDGLAAAEAEGIRRGLRVIRGVELSAHDDGGREVHLLGLHLDDVQTIAGELHRLRETRHERAIRIVEKLNALGVQLRLEDVLDEAAGGAVGRPHVARALVSNGYARDIRDAFDRYLGNSQPAYIEKARLDIADAIALVHQAGGLAILAHPGPEGRLERLQTFAERGLDGAEVRHPGHSGEDVTRIGAIVEHLKLVPSGGSDWHGATEGPRQLGTMRIPEEWLRRQEERLGTVRGRRTA